MESIKPLEMTLFLSYRGSKTRLTSCSVLLHLPPTFVGMNPLSSIAQGGQLITLLGSNLKGWAEQKQMAKAVHNGLAVHVDLVSVTDSAAAFRAPPMLLNVTDVFADAEVYLTIGTQEWYKVPYKLRYVDDGRISCNDAISITNFGAMHFNEPHETLVPVPSYTWRFPGSKEGMMGIEDAKKQDSSCSQD